MQDMKVRGAWVHFPVGYHFATAFFSSRGCVHFTDSVESKAKLCWLNESESWI